MHQQERSAASDTSLLSVSDTFTLTIIYNNFAPTLANPIPDKTIYEDHYFNFILNENTFNDVNVDDPNSSDYLTYVATLENGNALPSWLNFQASSRQFYGTPTNDDLGSSNIKVTATDTYDKSISDVFTLSVLNTNDTPIANSNISDKTINQDDMPDLDI